MDENDLQREYEERTGLCYYCDYTLIACVCSFDDFVDGEKWW